VKLQNNFVRESDFGHWTNQNVLLLMGLAIAHTPLLDHSDRSVICASKVKSKLFAKGAIQQISRDKLHETAPNFV